MSRVPFTSAALGTFIFSFILTAGILSARAEPAKPEKAHQIWHDLYGKECTSKAGAHFSFGRDGRYTYDGFWHDTGRYEIVDGEVTVAFDNGLGRGFSISREGARLLMEETAIECRSIF